MEASYTVAEQAALLALSRATLIAITSHAPLPPVDLDKLPPALAAPRACFVTLRRQQDGILRGCTGVLTPRRPLAEEVVAITQQTALNDPRFPPVQASEVTRLHIEISVLTPPYPLDYDGPDDLLRKLRPGIDGVTLQLGARRATFLPQVWERYPDPVEFLSLLADKMGCAPSAWQDPALEVEVYQAIVVEEEPAW